MTHFGLAVESIIATMLELRREKFQRDWKYHPHCMKPDFAVLKGRVPKAIVEVNHGESRDVFQRKLLRNIQSVYDAKAFFGADVSSVCIYLGRKSTLPNSSIDFLDCIFDRCLYPLEEDDISHSIHAQSLLDEALDKCSEIGETSLWLDEFLTNNAMRLEAWSKALVPSVVGASVKTLLKPVWDDQSAKHDLIEIADVSPSKSFFKDTVLSALALPEKVSESLFKVGSVAAKDFPEYSLFEDSGIVRSIKTIRGHSLQFEATIHEESEHPMFSEAFAIASKKLKNIDSARWHFEDLRDPSRIYAMIEVFSNTIRKRSRSALKTLLRSNILETNFSGIEHTRCWIADVIIAYSGRSQNAYNNDMLSSALYTGSLPNPFNNLVTKSERFMGEFAKCESAVDCLADLVLRQVNEEKSRWLGRDPDEIVKELFAARIYGAKGLQKFNPLFAVLEERLMQFGYEVSYPRIGSFVNDLVGNGSAIGKFDLTFGYRAHDRKSLYVNSLFVGRGYGADHKADEWGARRRLMEYRFADRKISAVKVPQTIFVYDGNWNAGNLNTLSRSGWDNVVNLYEFLSDDTLLK